MKVKIINYKKQFQIINRSEVVVKTIKPKWYSSEIKFYCNEKSYEIKKSSFWSSSYTIFELEQPIGQIDWSFMRGSVLRLKNNAAVSNEYTLKKENLGKWYTSERCYVLNKKCFTPVLTIHYDVKLDWRSTENISASFNDTSSTDYVLLVCALFLMRQQLSVEKSATSSGF